MLIFSVSLMILTALYILHEWHVTCNVCFSLIVLVFVLFSSLQLVHDFKLCFVTGLCDVKTGQSNIIVDIEESKGTCKLRSSFESVWLMRNFVAIVQETVPAELPIIGEPNLDIFLDLVFPKGPPIFFLNGKQLQLLSALDRDEENISHIVFQLTCTVKSTKKKKAYPVIVRLSDINDNSPVFVNAPYETTTSEVLLRIETSKLFSKPINTDVAQFSLTISVDTNWNDHFSKHLGHW